MTNVLSIAYPFAPVGPNLVGGAEQILWDLDRALVAAGDRSLVVACEGSQPAGRLFEVPLPRHEPLDQADREWCREQFRAAVHRALAADAVDLVHVHGMDLVRIRISARDSPADYASSSDRVVSAGGNREV